MINLTGTVRSEKGGGTTGHIGMVMTPAQFALILNSVPFIASVHPRLCDYDNPTPCTTNQQRTERYQEHGKLLKIFETKRMVDTKLKIYVMSCFNKDDYIELREDPIGYTNITIAALFVHLYNEYGEKTEALQNKTLDDLEDDVNIS